ncbi:unnamed protein product, partial [Ectocarpus sp. 12 AP-2014]
MTTEPNDPVVQVAGECFPPHLLGTLWRTAHAMVVIGNYRESTQECTYRNTWKPLQCLQRRNSHPTSHSIVHGTTCACGDTHQLLPNSTHSCTIGNRHDILHVRRCYIPTQTQINEVPDEERGTLKACFRWHHPTCARFPPACHQLCPPSSTTR